MTQTSEIMDLTKKMRHLAEHPSLITWQRTSEMADILNRAANYLDGCIIDRSMALSKETPNIDPANHVGEDVT